MDRGSPRKLIYRISTLYKPDDSALCHRSHPHRRQGSRRLDAQGLPPESDLSHRREYLQDQLTSNGLVWIFAIVVFAAVLLRSGKTIDPQGQGNVFSQEFFPVGAVSWLETHPQNGHMFNEFDWGGYLLLKLWPRYQIFMDGHTHIYGEALTREYEQVLAQGDGWQKILNKYDVRWAIIRVNTPLAR